MCDGSDVGLLVEGTLERLVLKGGIDYLVSMVYMTNISLLWWFHTYVVHSSSFFVVASVIE